MCTLPDNGCNQSIPKPEVEMLYRYTRGYPLPRYRRPGMHARQLKAYIGVLFSLSILFVGDLL